MSNITRANVSYSLNQPLNLDAPYPIVARRDPGTADKAPIGQEWVNTVTNSVFFLTSIANNAANWVNIAGGAGVFSSLTVNPGPTNLSTVGVGAVNIGNAANTSAVTITSGAGGVSIVGGGNTISIGADGAANTVDIGSATGDAVLSLNAGTGGATLTTVNGAITINSGTGALGISTDAAATTLSIATGAAVKLLTVGSTNGASATTIQAGTAGIDLSAAGNVQVVNGSATAASPTATLILNKRVGQAKFTGFTTAAAASQAFTIQNTTINSGATPIIVTAGNLGANNALMTLVGVVVGVGEVVVTLTNNGTQALNGDVNINFWVLN